MAQKPETVFRTGRVDPFLKSLRNAKFFSIQQVSIVGTPDKLGVINGRFVGLELKAKGGKLSAMQAFNLHEIEKAGGVALTVSPDNWEETKFILQQLDQGEQKW